MDKKLEAAWNFLAFSHAYKAMCEFHHKFYNVYKFVCIFFLRVRKNKQTSKQTNKNSKKNPPQAIKNSTVSSSAPKSMASLFIF